MTLKIDLNSDMGEGFGAWSIGDDVDLDIMPLISSANTAVYLVRFKTHTSIGHLMSDAIIAYLWITEVKRFNLCS